MKMSSLNCLYSTTADETSSCQEDQKRTGVTKEQMKKETIQRHGNHLLLSRIVQTKSNWLTKHVHMHMTYTCILSSVVLLCFNSGVEITVWVSRNHPGWKIWSRRSGAKICRWKQVPTLLWEVSTTLQIISGQHLRAGFIPINEIHKNLRALPSCARRSKTFCPASLCHSWSLRGVKFGMSIIM